MQFRVCQVSTATKIKNKRQQLKCDPDILHNNIPVELLVPVI